jgi:predicted nucleotidyltransferase
VLSVPPERAPARTTLVVLTAVDRVARDLRLDYFVTGATARDILLNGVYGIETGRATMDVDLAVAIETWSHFDAVKARLVASGAFAADDRIPHKLIYREDARQPGYPLDLLPFGGIEDGRGAIVWPPDPSMVMNVTGYREAFAAAQEVEASSSLVVRVVSLPALAILKLLAWVDRRGDTTKDADDLVTLLRWYHEAGNEDRLYGEFIDLVESLRYDLDLAGPRILGIDAARIIDRATRDQVLAVLDNQVELGNLLRHMARAVRGRADPFGDARRWIGEFRTGLQSG